MKWTSKQYPRTGLMACVMVVLAAALAAGCARKAVEAPPTPATPPAQSQTQTPTPSTPAPSTTTTTTEITTNDFRPVFYDYDSSTLRDDARSALDHNARLLRDNGDIRLTIEGHCDERGTVEYNQALGERRAQSAVEYLVAAGISASRLSVVSYGKEKPFDSGHDERAWALNRRAHLVVQ